MRGHDVASGKTVAPLALCAATPKHNHDARRPSLPVYLPVCSFIYLPYLPTCMRRQVGDTLGKSLATGSPVTLYTVRHTLRLQSPIFLHARTGFKWGKLSPHPHLRRQTEHRTRLLTSAVSYCLQLSAYLLA